MLQADNIKPRFKMNEKIEIINFNFSYYFSSKL